MARAGLLKSDVKKARDSLLAQQINPSVDAVRVALGNTGSKTTIHKYLKELDDSTEGIGSQVSLSEALQDLVSRLAMQLQDEADTRIEEMRALGGEKERQHVTTITELQSTVTALNNQVSRLETESFHERTAKTALQESLQQETLARHTADQQVSDLKERLAENESHRQSLEEKHQHAREALEHYRQSVKEQRDQDQRRHEQQLQHLQAELRQAQQSIIVKQEEVTRLNQDGVRLIGDLTHVRQALQEVEGSNRRQAQKLEKLHAAEQRNEMLAAQLVEKEERAKALQEQFAGACMKLEGLSNQVRALELAEAKAQAKLAAQKEITNELRNYLDEKTQPSTN